MFKFPVSAAQNMRRCSVSPCAFFPATGRSPASTMLLRLAVLVSLLPAHAQPEIEGPCQLTDGGVCATSPQYPRNYPANEQCTFSNIPSSMLEVIHFDVEADPFPTIDRDGEDGGDCDLDYLKVNGKRYCGRVGPAGVVVDDGIVEWISDSDTVRSGWKACSPPSPSPPRDAPDNEPLCRTDLLGYSTSEGTAGAAAASAATAATATTAATAIAAATVTTANAATSGVVDKAAAYALQGCSCERVKHED